MARLRFKNSEPNGGWTYRQKESNLRIKGESLGDLVSRVKAHRLHKGLTPTDPETIQLEVERQLCGRLGNSQCIAEGRDDDWVPVSEDSDVTSIEKIQSFSRSAWEWMTSGRELVPMQEVQRRRAICLDCPANLDSGHSCFNCALGKLISHVVPAERRFTDLKTCGFCGCELSSKVSMPDSVIVASDVGRNITYPVPCWQRAILEHHKSLPSQPNGSNPAP